MGKTICLIDPKATAYLGEAAHLLNPVETEHAGESVYAALNPDLAVDEALIAIPDGMQAIQSGSVWNSCLALPR
jgi:hypothetical protein